MAHCNGPSCSRSRRFFPEHILWIVLLWVCDLFAALMASLRPVRRARPAVPVCRAAAFPLTIVSPRQSRQADTYIFPKASSILMPCKLPTRFEALPSADDTFNLGSSAKMMSYNKPQWLTLCYWFAHTNTYEQEWLKYVEINLWGGWISINILKYLCSMNNACFSPVDLLLKQICA